MLVAPILSFAPFLLKIAKQAALPKVGAIGPLRLTLPHPEGNLIKDWIVVIGPSIAIARPSNLAPTPKTIAALLTINVPFIIVPVAKSVAPSIFQNTLQA